MADFEQAVILTLKHEGGFCDDPQDPGGATNFGISQRAYPSKDIRNLTKAEAIVIYKHDYWLTLYDQIESQQLANALFDFGVNAGLTVAVKTVQRALNDLLVGPMVVDGVFGPATLSAVNSCDPDALVKQFTVRRITYYSSLNKPKFMRGWTARAVDYA